MNNKKITVLGIAGSLRSQSYNKAALRAAQGLVPDKMDLVIFERLGEIPPFNQDEEYHPPEVVKELKERIIASDAILFATPEYNYSMSGVLKNAIDWASRPYELNAFDGKPAAIMGASISLVGTGRAQCHLRQSCVFLNMFPLNYPEVMIGTAQDKVDHYGNMTDAHTCEKIRELLDALLLWVKKLQ